MGTEAMTAELDLPITPAEYAHGEAQAKCTREASLGGVDSRPLGIIDRHSVCRLENACRAGFTIHAVGR
jgi:hypothetical protein